MTKTLSLLFLAIVLMASTTFAETFQLDIHQTQINFSVKHLVIFTAHGDFTDFSGSIQVDPEHKILIAAEATILTASVDTGNEKRDNYLRSQKFFNVEKYPEISFKSRKVIGSGNNITMIGDITIKGITKEIILKGSFLGTTQDPHGEFRARLNATGTISRKEFGLKQNKSTELMLGNIIQIKLGIVSIAKQTVQ